MISRVPCATVILTTALAVLTCAMAPKLGYDQHSEEMRAREFLDRFDSAICSHDWPFIESSFANAERIVFIGPPPEERQVFGTKEQVVATLRREGQRRDYGRRRSIEAVVIEPEPRTAIVISILETRFLDDFATQTALTLVETAAIRLDDEQPSFSSYEIRIVDFPQRVVE